MEKPLPFHHERLFLQLRITSVTELQEGSLLCYSTERESSQLAAFSSTRFTAETNKPWEDSYFNKILPVVEGKRNNLRRACSLTQLFCSSCSTAFPAPVALSLLGVYKNLFTEGLHYFIELQLSVPPADFASLHSSISSFPNFCKLTSCIAPLLLAE